jgi:hypothetical protein
MLKLSEDGLAHTQLNTIEKKQRTKSTQFNTAATSTASMLTLPTRWLPAGTSRGTPHVNSTPSSATRRRRSGLKFWCSDLGTHTTLGLLHDTHLTTAHALLATKIFGHVVAAAELYTTMAGVGVLPFDCTDGKNFSVVTSPPRCKLSTWLYGRKCLSSSADFQGSGKGFSRNGRSHSGIGRVASILRICAEHQVKSQ